MCIDRPPFPRRPWQAAVLALAITTTQVALTCAMAGEVDVQKAYHALFQWDSGWFREVVVAGYHSPTIPTSRDYGDVAFFPAYPVSARLLQRATRLSVDTAMLLTAQVECWGFWTYVLLLLRRWRTPGPLVLLAVLAIAAHPAAFFLVAGYSEALYLMMFAGFVYWADKTRTRSGVAAAAHGLVMTATRLVGLPLALYPVCRAYFKHHDQESRPLGQSLLVAGAAALGAFAYFAYCSWCFADWDVYGKAEAAGWSVQPNYLALLSTQMFHIGWPSLRETAVDPEYLSRLSVPVAVAWFLGLGLVELVLARRQDTAWRARISLYLSAALMFYVCVCGHASRGMSSMVRFALCIEVPLVLGLIHLLTQLPPVGRTCVRGFLMAGAGFWCAVSLALQLALAYRFTHGLWVA
jgi:hypothetical protein